MIKKKKTPFVSYCLSSDFKTVICIFVCFIFNFLGKRQVLSFGGPGDCCCHRCDKDWPFMSQGDPFWVRYKVGSFNYTSRPLVHDIYSRA